MSEEQKTKLKSLIEEYEICYKESEYEGNAEEYKSLKETHKLLEDILNLIDRLQKELDKKDKVINKFAEDRLFLEGCRYLFNCFTKEDVIDYYYKLVEGEND